MQWRGEEEEEKEEEEEEEMMPLYWVHSAAISCNLASFSLSPAGKMTLEELDEEGGEGEEELDGRGENAR